jgi:hypothetical protein
MEVGQDVSLDRSQPHRTHGSGFGKRFAVTLRPQRQCGKIVEVAGDEAL